MIKRCFDIIFSIIGLALLSPILLVIGLIIRLDSKGPVIYKQDRVGKRGADFKIFKFRTMRLNADKQGLLTVGDRDPRITKFGYFLRKYKLDEFPQLFNVLMGSMSFVGPRPEVRKYVNYYTKSDQEILQLKPGITDYASIHFRNEAELLKSASDSEKTYLNEIMPEKIRLNKIYLREHSIIIDFKIIFKTLLSIIS